MLLLGFLFFGVDEIPAFMAIGMVFVYSLYAATFLVGVYLLMRRSTREGIRENNGGSIATAEMAGTADSLPYRLLSHPCLRSRQIRATNWPNEWLEM